MKCVRLDRIHRKWIHNNARHHQNVVPGAMVYSVGPT